MNIIYQVLLILSFGFGFYAAVSQLFKRNLLLKQIFRVIAIFSSVIVLFIQISTKFEEPSIELKKTKDLFEITFKAIGTHNEPVDSVELQIFNQTFYTDSEGSLKVEFDSAEIDIYQLHSLIALKKGYENYLEYVRPINGIFTIELSEE